MDIHWLSPAGIEQHHVADLPALLTREDGFVWVDFPEDDEQAPWVLRQVFRFHPLAIQDCLERRHIPKVHVYPDHLFVILHAPEPRMDGRVHLRELNQFVGSRYLITIHGSLDKAGLGDVPLPDPQTVLQRITARRYAPRSAYDLSYAVVSALTRRMEEVVATLTGNIAALEQQVLQGTLSGAEQVLEEMFGLRHALLTLRTSAAQNREMYARLSVLAPRFMPLESRAFIEDLLDQFDRVRSMCDGEREFLQGVIDFYQTRTVTKINLVMQRLTLITALLLPVLAVAAIYGMNILVFKQTSLVHLAGVLTMIGLMTGGMFWWAKRQGWW